MLERTGRFCGRWRLPVIVVWVAIVIGLGVVSKAQGGQPRDKFEIPGSQSQHAANLLASQFPAASGSSATVVFQTASGSLTDPGPKTAIDQTMANLKALPKVTPAVTGP